jgi:hypothetical protein
MSFILASNWRGFILAMRDRDRANKNEIEIFVFSVTSNDFPHDVLLLIFSLKIGAAIRNRGRSWMGPVTGSTATDPPAGGLTYHAAGGIVHHGKFWLPMSALGQKQTWKLVRVMSALPPKADID